MSSHKNILNQIKQILGPDGIVASSISGYEHRAQQVQMAMEVYTALVSDDRLIIEAPTGTGKTLAYLVAAALSRKRVAISTGTKNLQEQLFFKDLPFVREKIFPDLKAALLKGRNNFVCHSRFRRFLRQPFLYERFDEIVAWYKQTRVSGQGDRSELENLPDDDPVWPEICSTTETCLGKKCPDREECFIFKMRARAVDADLMIVNHHLLVSDLAVRESGFGEVIPRYDALIVDEAHGLEDAATQHFGFHLSYFRIARLVRDMHSELSAVTGDNSKFEKILAQIEENGRRLFSIFSDKVFQRMRLQAIDSETTEVRDVLSQNLESLASMTANLPELSDELRSIARRALEIRRELEIILSPESDGTYACWVERRERTILLHASPVEVGDFLKTSLYEKVPAIVFTSATLSSGGNFDYFKARLGLNGNIKPTETILDSPFDYSRQAILYIPRNIPEPNSSDFAPSLIPILQDILSRTSGRAFVLFTSYKNLDTVREGMIGRVPFPLLVQGEKPKTRLLEEFRHKKGSVLLATASFWEGVDVQGEALSCVIVDRLPFAPPDDPIIGARIDRLRHRGQESFYSLQVPMAVISLKQGFGRLIRTRSDRGVLCILDVRILTKPYGKIFRKSLYECPISRDLSDIENFFSVEKQPLNAGTQGN